MLNPDAVSLQQRRWYRSTAFWLGTSLLVLTFAFYIRAVHFEFIGFDDYKYVVSNHQIRVGLSWATVRTAFTQTFYTNYSPLLILLELTISSLFGHGAAAYHGTNVLLHAINAALVFVFLLRTGGRPWIAAAAAAMWAWHPLRVESVAWVSELKDELCGFFWLLTVLAYLRFGRCRSGFSYIWVVLLCTAALASKPMAVTLPAVLLLLDIYPLDRFSGAPGRSRAIAIAVLEKLPLLALSALWSHLTTLTQTHRFEASTSMKVANAVVSAACYLRDTVLPRHLAVFYPHPALIGHTIPASQVAISLSLLVAITAAAVAFAFRRKFGPLVGWLWFLGTLVPVIGLLQGNEVARADRYTYLPSIGLAAAAVWLFPSRVNPPSEARHSTRLVVIAISVIAILSAEVVAMEKLLSTWRTTETLFTHAFTVTESNYLAIDEIADARLNDHQYGEAMAWADRALAIRPNDRYALFTRAKALIDLDRKHEAVQALRLAMQANPSEPVLSRMAGNLMVSLKRNDQAEKMYQQAIGINPDDAIAHADYGDLLASLNRLPEAEHQWTIATQIEPKIPYPHVSLAKAASQRGDRRSAIAHYYAAVHLSETKVDPQWRINLAWLEATTPGTTDAQVDDAVTQANLAVPDPSAATPLDLDTLAAALARSSQFDRAVTIAEQAERAARAAKNTSLADAIHSRLQRYRQSQPFLTGPS